MKLSNEQIEQILDGAPEGATHYAQGMHYLACNSSGNWMRYDPNGIGGLCWFDANEFKFKYTKSFYSLADLVEILTLRQEVERLKGIKPEFPPRPQEGVGLPRYGLKWNGHTKPLTVPMDDGYWTPYHLAVAQQSEVTPQAAEKDESRWLYSLYDNNRKVFKRYISDGFLEPKAVEDIVNGWIESPPYRGCIVTGCYQIRENGL